MGSYNSFKYKFYYQSNCIYRNLSKKMEKIWTSKGVGENVQDIVYKAVLVLKDMIDRLVIGSSLCGSCG